MTEDSSEHDMDLPLMSDIRSRYVEHYILNLECNFSEKIFSGDIVIFSKHAGPSGLDGDKLDPTVPHVNNIQGNIATGNLDPTVCDGNSIKIHNQIYEDVSELRQATPTNSKESVTAGDVDVETNIVTDGASDEKVESQAIYKINDSSDDHECCDKHFLLERSDEIKKPGINDEVDTKPGTFVFVLDSSDIHVEHIEELEGIQSDKAALEHVGRLELLELIRDCKKSALNFEVKRHCIRIWKEGVCESAQFPDVVKIVYRTHPSGKSLKWTRDQDGNACVFTHGHWLNNRSLFPSQDIPGALATWSAYIHAPIPTTVLMTGDHIPIIWNTHSDYRTHFYSSDIDMPSSTLALAVGYWKEVGSSTHRFTEMSKNEVPYRLFAPKCLSESTEDILLPYLPRCMEAASNLLGPYPFYRMDILIVPSSFNSLGMASPSLMFLSQSVLSDDQSMLVRVAHELSHTWFGILIGPKDWTEEWLTEGFCTFTEWIIHSTAMQISDQDARKQKEILDSLKYRNLKAEMNVVDPDLQTLRPNKSDVTTEDQDVCYVKNGMNPDKGFIQFHYFKGYFLLCYLESIVGCENFHVFIRQLVQQYHHQLINSQDVLSLFIEKFEYQCGGRISVKSICHDWLDTAGIPKFITTYIETLSSNKMFQTVKHNIAITSGVNSSYSGMHWRKRRRMDIAGSLELKAMNIPQTLLFLEMLLEEKRLHAIILHSLNDLIHLSTSNADVQHKWCELVVKYRVETHYIDVENFLINHQAMGVYLFGELIINKDKEQRKIAETVFNKIKGDMETGVYKVVCQMIYGGEQIT